MDDYKQISARVPEEIHQALEWLMNHLEMSKAQAIRYAITEACQQHGRIVEDTMPQWGGTRPRDFDPEYWGMSEEEILDYYETPEELYTDANDTYPTTIESVLKWWEQVTTE